MTVEDTDLLKKDLSVEPEAEQSPLIQQEEEDLSLNELDLEAAEPGVGAEEAESEEEQRKRIEAELLRRAKKEKQLEAKAEMLALLGAFALGGSRSGGMEKLLTAANALRGKMDVLGGLGTKNIPSLGREEGLSKGVSQ